MALKKDHVFVLLEDMQSKFDLLIEGHASLRQEMQDGFVAVRQEVRDNRVVLEQMIKAVATELAAHREDTEKHAGGYRVGEST